jgi:hypothetical protein
LVFVLLGEQFSAADRVMLAPGDGLDEVPEVVNPGPVLVAVLAVDRVL